MTTHPHHRYVLIGWPLFLEAKMIFMGYLLQNTRKYPFILNILWIFLKNEKMKKKKGRRFSSGDQKFYRFSASYIDRTSAGRGVLNMFGVLNMISSRFCKTMSETRDLDLFRLHLLLVSFERKNLEQNTGLSSWVMKSL